MPLEAGNYISDLNSSWPVDATDVVGEGDDHLRLLKRCLQGNVAGDNQGTRLLVNEGEIGVNALPNELMVMGADAANIVMRLRRRSDDANRGTLYWNEGNARLQMAAQNNAGSTASMRLQVQGAVGGNQTVMDALGDGDTIFSADGGERLRLLAAGGLSVTGDVSMAGSLALSAAGATPVGYTATNDNGGFGVGIEGDADIVLEQRDLAGVVESVILRRVRNDYAEVFHGSQDAAYAWRTHARGINVGPDGTESAGQGGQVILQGEGANPTFTVENDAGRLRLIAGTTQASRWATDGKLTQITEALFNSKVSVNAILYMQDAGVDQLSLEAGAATSTVRSVGNLALVRNATDGVFLAGATETALQVAGVSRLSVLATSVNGSFGSVEDEDDVPRPIGYNAMPTLTISNPGTVHELTNADCGKKIRLNAVNQVLKVMDGLDNDHTCTVWNDSNGDCTIEGDTGITLSRFTGAGKVAGNYTIPSGARITLTRRGSSTTWFIG